MSDSLLEPIAWGVVEETIIYLSNINVQLNDSLLFDQLTYLNKKLMNSKKLYLTGKLYFSLLLC